MGHAGRDRKSTRLNSSHGYISYAVFCLKKKTKKKNRPPRPAVRDGHGACDEATVHVAVHTLATRRSVSRPRPRPRACFFFFFNDTATTEIYTLSLHDALPI